MRKIAVISQKGGVGKTTTSMNLAHALRLAGKKVLLIDMDPQENLSNSLGIFGNSIPGIGAVLLEEFDVNESVVKLENGLSIIPAGSRLGELEFVSKGGSERGFRLQKALQELKGKFDFILIDCPPSAGMLGMNALMAVKELIIPVSSDYLSMQGLSRLMGILQHIESKLHTRNQKWVVLTRYQKRRKLAQEVKDKILQYFPKQVLKTSIRESVALAESPSYCKTIFEYKKLSYGAEDYLNLAKDVIHKKTA